jgi:hypothetical protein
MLRGLHIEIFPIEGLYCGSHSAYASEHWITPNPIHAELGLGKQYFSLKAYLPLSMRDLLPNHHLIGASIARRNSCIVLDVPCLDPPILPLLLSFWRNYKLVSSQNRYLMNRKTEWVLSVSHGSEPTPFFC